jgi:hypothetical protein
MIYPLSLKKQSANAYPKGIPESLARNYASKTLFPPLNSK